MPDVFANDNYVTQHALSQEEQMPGRRREGSAISREASDSLPKP